MKIVYLSNSLIPSRAANSIHVMKMCAAFAGNGHTVQLFAPSRPGRADGINDIFEYYGVEKTFDVQFLSWPGVKGSSYVYAVLAAIRARWNGADLVYTRFLAGGFAAAMTGSKLIYEAHQPAREQSRMLDWLFRLLRKRAAFRRIVVITSALKQRFIEEYPDISNKIVVAHDGADPVDSQHAPVSLKGCTDALQVGYVGQLYSGKGVELIGPLAREYPRAQFHVIGGSPGDTGRWRREFNGIENVHFYGFVPPGDVHGYLNRFDVVLAPYQRKVSVFGGRGDVARWMSPLKLFEYMAAARAIVCSDLPVLREVLEDGRTALFCDPESIESWSAALRRLDSDPAFRQSLGLQARDNFLQHYTWAARARRVLHGIEPKDRGRNVTRPKNHEKLPNT